jgi:hypothetical protein
MNNGTLELVIENLQGLPTILRPRSTLENHWVSFELQAKDGNKLALNARVRVTSADGVQTGEVLSGGSYLSQSELRLHFGLGNQQAATKVEVIWPDHSISTFTDVAADRFYYIKEGDHAPALDTRISPNPRPRGNF